MDVNGGSSVFDSLHTVARCRACTPQAGGTHGMLVVVRTFELNLGEYREVVGRVTTVALLIDGDVLLNLDAGGHENKVDAGIRCD